MNLYWIDEKSLSFPPLEYATPEGIVAVGGDLSVERLLLAYSSGIFPWYSEDEPILWWSPDPRFVLFPENLKISKSMKKIIKKNIFRVTFDQAFEEVIVNCSDLRKNDGTWITNEMIEAYCELHKQGFAHSVETWLDDKLVGGLYGVSLGQAFFGESMFSKVDNSSKFALIKLTEFAIKNEFTFIDCQVYTKHLDSLGAVNILRSEFVQTLKNALSFPSIKGSWKNLTIN